MYINKKIIEEILQINTNLIENYEQNNLYIYKQLAGNKLYWESTTATIFFDKIDEYRKNDIDIYYLKELNNYMKKICTRYSEIGNTIKYNEDSRVTDKINEIQKNINSIDKEYIELQEISKDYSEKISNIKNQKEQYMAITSRIEEKKEEIEEIESYLRKSLLDIDIELIPEMENLNYIFNENTEDRIYIEPTEIENNVLRTLKMIKEKKEISSKITMNFNKILENYKTNNFKQLEEKINIINTNFKRAINYIENYLEIFNKVVTDTKKSQEELNVILNKTNQIIPERNET